MTVILIAALLQVTPPPPPPPVVGAHLFPAPAVEQTTAAHCGKGNATVRIAQVAATPDRAWRQSVTIVVNGTPLARAEATRLDAAIAAFGAVTHVGIDCAAGVPAQLRFRGAWTGSAPERSLILDLDGNHIAAIR